MKTILKNFLKKLTDISPLNSLIIIHRIKSAFPSFDTIVKTIKTYSYSDYFKGLFVLVAIALIYFLICEVISLQEQVKYLVEELTQIKSDLSKPPILPGGSGDNTSEAGKSFLKNNLVLFTVGGICIGILGILTVYVGCNPDILTSFNISYSGTNSGQAGGSDYFYDCQ